MNSKKRLLALSMAAIMLFAMLAGCAGTETGPSETPGAAATDTPAPTEAPITVEPIDKDKTVNYPITTDDTELSIFFFGMPMVVEALEDTTNNAAFRLAEAATGVHFVSQGAMPWMSAELFGIMSASQDYTDLVFQFYSLYNFGFDHAVEEDVIYDLKDMLETCAPDYLRALGQFEDGLDVCTTDAGYVPEIGMVGWDEPRVEQGLFIRGDWLEGLNMDVPVTYDDFHDYLVGANTEYGAQGMFMMSTGVFADNYLASGYGINAYQVVGFLSEYAFYQVDGVVRHGWTEPGFKDYITMMNQWYSEGLINYDTLLMSADWSNPDNYSYINNGDVSMWYRDFSTIGTVESYNADSGCIVLPVADAVMNEGDTLHFQKTANRYGLGVSGCSVTTSCADPELAVKWLNWWFTEEGMMASNYGELGVTYEMVDGVPQYTELITGSEMGALTAWNINCNNITGTYYINSRLDMIYLDRELDAMDIWASNSDDAYVYSSLITMTADEGSEFNSLMTEINTYASETVLKFIRGERPISEFDAFVEQMNTMGLQRTIELKQIAYARFYG